MRVFELLQHLQLVVNHALIAPDIFLQDNLDCNLLAVIRFRLPHNTVCACAEGVTESVECPKERSGVNG